MWWLMLICLGELWAILSLVASNLDQERALMKQEDQIRKYILDNAALKEEINVFRALRK